MPAPLNADAIRPSSAALMLRVPLRETMFYGGCITWTRGDAFVQPNQFDPESDPEGEAVLLQRDISELLLCLNNVSLFHMCC